MIGIELREKVQPYLAELMNQGVIALPKALPMISAGCQRSTNNVRLPAPHGVVEWEREFVERRCDRAAVRVPEHHDQAGAELFRRKFDAANLRGRDDIAGNTDDKEIAETAVKDHLIWPASGVRRFRSRTALTSHRSSPVP